MQGAVVEKDTTEACLSIPLMLNPFLKRKANTKTTAFREIPTLPFKKFFLKIFSQIISSTVRQGIAL
jgi:hypothetical protein